MSVICDAHKKKVGVKLLYNSVHSWGSDEIETRCGRKNQAPDWAVAVANKMLDWGTCPWEAGPPGPRLSSPEEWERNVVMANRVGVNMLQFCLVSNSLSHTTLSIKWEVYFSKQLCCSSLLCWICFCIYVLCGYTTFEITLFLHLNDVLMLNWIVWNRTVYIYINRFGIK